MTSSQGTYSGRLHSPVLREEAAHTLLGQLFDRIVHFLIAMSDPEVARKRRLRTLAFGVSATGTTVISTLKSQSETQAVSMEDEAYRWQRDKGLPILVLHLQFAYQQWSTPDGLATHLLRPPDTDVAHQRLRSRKFMGVKHGVE